MKVTKHAETTHSKKGKWKKGAKRKRKGKFAKNASQIIIKDYNLYLDLYLNYSYKISI